MPTKKKMKLKDKTPRKDAKGGRGHGKRKIGLRDPDWEPPFRGGILP